MATDSQHQESAEYKTFRLNYDRMVRTIQDPLSLATRLFARGIIDSVMLESANIPAFSRFQNTHTLLSAVGRKIQTNPSVFHVFLSALKEDCSMQSLVEIMEGISSANPKWYECMK